MFSFLDYTREIFVISRDKHVDLGIAFSMLKADIRNGNRFNTGDVDLGSFDLESAHRAFKLLTDHEELDVYEERFEFMRKHYNEVCDVWDKPEALAELIAKFRSQK